MCHLAGEPALGGTQSVLLLLLAAVEVASVVPVGLQEVCEAARRLGKLLLHPGLLDALRCTLQLRRRRRIWFTCIRKSIIFGLKGSYCTCKHIGVYLAVELDNRNVACLDIALL